MPTTSETRAALYPEKPFRMCSCGVLYAVRLREVDGENPDLCTTCNRKDWSVLHGYVRRKAGPRGLARAVAS